MSNATQRHVCLSDPCPSLIPFPHKTLAALCESEAGESLLLCVWLSVRKAAFYCYCLGEKEREELMVNVNLGQLLSCVGSASEWQVSFPAGLGES